ncbi:MAG: regulatory protein RecX [Clostridia bacterium]|nr:regulatory protein RecX [Clostridia bacterium]
MVITDIVKVKRHKKYEVYADGELLVVLSDFGIVDCRIKIGVEVDNDMLEKIEDAKRADAFETLLRSLAMSGTTVSRAKNKLREKGIGEEYVEYAIKKAKEYGYLNDDEYAENYVSSSRGKSKLRIRYELMERGISSNKIDDALLDFDEENACTEALEKSLRAPLLDAEKKKFFAKLCNQGFPYDLVKRCYEKYVEENF